ncbi:MAG: glycosyltransferase, partial [Solirubrobacterales bacterium]
MRYAAEIDLLDMDEASIEACLQRLRPLSLPVNYYVNDGHSCGMLPASQRYDIIASFDSMVHMPPDVIAEYLRQFTPRLKPDGFMWLDHSGRGARELGDRTDMTPEKMAEIADDSGLRVDTTWFRNDHDCISVLRKRARHNGAAIGNGLDQSPHSQKPIFVSVVVPVYDVAPELLRPCLESLRLQTLREDEFEIIIVDDASTNKATRALIEEFAESVPHCRLVRHETNRGLNQARRAGRASALGTHILFVDGDDVLTRDAVETLRMHAHKTGADIVMGGFLRWSPSERAFRPFDPANRSLPAEHMDSIRAAFGAKVSYTMCGRLFRAEVLPDELFVLPDLISEDVATFVRALLRARSTHYIGRTVYFYTDNPTSKTSAFSTKHVNDMFRLFQDWREQA